MRRDRVYRIRYDGVDVTTNDLTVGDLIEIERTSGVPWVLINPFANVKVARALLAVALLNAGRPEADVEQILTTLTLPQLADAFDEVEDPPLLRAVEEAHDSAPDEEQTPVPLDRPSPSDRGSSHGGQAGSGGRRRSHGRNA